MPRLKYIDYVYHRHCGRNQAQALRAKRAADVELLRKEELQSQTYVAQLKRNRSKYQKDLAAKKKQVEALNREIERIIAASMRGKGTGKIKQSVDVAHFCYAVADAFVVNALTYRSSCYVRNLDSIRPVS